MPNMLSSFTFKINSDRTHFKSLKFFYLKIIKISFKEDSVFYISFISLSFKFHSSPSYVRFSVCQENKLNFEIKVPPATCKEEQLTTIKNQENPTKILNKRA